MFFNTKHLGKVHFYDMNCGINWGGLFWFGFFFVCFWVSCDLFWFVLVCFFNFFSFQLLHHIGSALLNPQKGHADIVLASTQMYMGKNIPITKDQKCIQDDELSELLKTRPGPT